MGVTTYLAIGGLGATVILGVISIFLFFRRRYPGKLTFFFEDSISLFDSIVRNLPELDVLHEGEPVSENVVLLKGYFINSGSKDISPAMVEGALTAVLPKDYKWLNEGAIVSSSPAVKASTRRINDTELAFDLGFFRCGEHVKFEALVELPSKEDSSNAPANELKDSISFTHRILDTQKVNEQAVPSPIPRSTFIANGFLLLLMIVMIGLLTRAVIRSSPEPHNGLINYVINDEDGRPIEIELVPRLDQTLVLVGTDEEFESESTLKEFFKGCDCQPRVVPDPLDNRVKQFLIGFGVILALFALLLISPMIINLRKIRRVKYLLEGGES